MMSQKRLDSAGKCVTAKSYACCSSKGVPNVSHWYSDLGIPMPCLSHPAFHSSVCLMCKKKNKLTRCCSNNHNCYLDFVWKAYVFIRQLPTHTEHSSSLHKLLLSLEGLLKDFFLDSPILPTYYSSSPLQPAITSSFASSSRSFHCKCGKCVKFYITNPVTEE